MVCCFTTCALLGTVGAYACCLFKLLPPALMRLWFVIVTVFSLGTVAVICWLIHFVGGKLGTSLAEMNRLCAIAAVIGFRAMRYLCPHIEVDVEGVKEFEGLGGPSCILMNHTSFWDAPLFCTVAPISYLQYCRTLMKASLTKMVIFGGVFERVGHFPVYFKSDETGQFSVDKERQAPVLKRMEEHLDNKGHIALFPEGVVNAEPRKLCPFRHGSFNVILERKLPVYLFVMVGNEVTWPRTAFLGGFPAKIKIRVAKMDVDYNDSELCNKKMAGDMQDKMQVIVDELHAKLDSEAGKKTN